LGREYFDEAGKLLETEKWTNLETIDSVSTPLEMIMPIVQDGSRALLRFGDVDYNLTLSDQGFSPQTLAAALQMPPSVPGPSGAPELRAAMANGRG
jgi:hypothetical protein